MIEFPSLGGVTVRTSVLLGETVTPPYPRKLTRYKQRTLKRWRKLHPSYNRSTGQFYIVGGNEIWCHPDDLALLRQWVEVYNATHTESRLFL